MLLEFNDIEECAKNLSYNIYEKVVIATPTEKIRKLLFNETIQLLPNEPGIKFRLNKEDLRINDLLFLPTDLKNRINGLRSRNVVVLNPKMISKDILEILYSIYHFSELSPKEKILNNVL